MLEIILLVVCLVLFTFLVIPTTIQYIQYKLEQRKINNILNYFETRLENK